MISPQRLHLLGAALAAALAAAPALAGYATPGDPTPTAESAAGRSDLYRDGQRALAEERWAAAAATFARLAAEGGAESDAALYWKAYAETRDGRKGDALATIRQLLSAHPESAWADDARALELDLRGPEGEREREERPARKELSEDEELKLYALDGLMQVEPERAIPVLERFLAGAHPVKLKERALFVLSQSDSPRARDILLRTVRNGEPVELRVRAVQTLGIAGEAEDLAALATVFREPSPRAVREAVLDAYLIAGEPAPLVAAAKAETDPLLRGKAIELLGAMDEGAALRELWASEKEPRLRAKLLEAFGIAGDVEALARAVASESEPALRAKAIEGLGITDSPVARRHLLAIYRSAQDPRDKRKVLEALMIQDDAQALIELFREEKDPQLKKEIVHQLSLLDSEEAESLIFGLLEEKP